MKRLFNFVIQRWHWAFFLSWIIPPLLIILALIWVLFFVPDNAYLWAEKMGALWLLAGSLLVILPGVIAGTYYWRSRIVVHQPGLSIRLYPEGFGDIDYILVEKLFPNCQEVKLYPLAKGFSGAMVFIAESLDKDGSLQQRSVVKLGPIGKIQDEAKNYNKYVKEFVRNAPELREPQYKDHKGGLRFSYAGMEGEVSTFEDLFLTRKKDGCMIIRKAFSKSVLGLCLLKQGPPEQRHLYEDYRPSEEDWDRIINAVKALKLLKVEDDCFNFGDQAYPNPLKKAEEWFGLDRLEKEKENRLNKLFETIIAVVHGDLNARNTLIDANDNVFVIDFAQTGPGHILKDFCKLEVEIKFCLTKLVTEADVKRVVDWEKRLLFAESGQRHKTLRGLLTVAEDDLGFDKATTDCIRELRQKAHDMIGPLLNEPPDQYYLGLLHYTLDTLRYAQCDRNSKLYALISASLLCRALR